MDKFNAFLTIIAYIFAAGAFISLLSTLFSIGYYTKTKDGKREAEILRKLLWIKILQELCAIGLKTSPSQLILGMEENHEKKRDSPKLA